MSLFVRGGFCLQRRRKGWLEIVSGDDRALGVRRVDEVREQHVPVLLTVPYPAPVVGEEYTHPSDRERGGLALGLVEVVETRRRRMVVVAAVREQSHGLCAAVLRREQRQEDAHWHFLTIVLPSLAPQPAATSWHEEVAEDDVELLWRAIDAGVPGTSWLVPPAEQLLPLAVVANDRKVVIRAELPPRSFLVDGAVVDDKDLHAFHFVPVAVIAAVVVNALSTGGMIALPILGHLYQKNSTLSTGGMAQKLTKVDKG